MSTRNPIIEDETGPPELADRLPTLSLNLEDYRADLAEFELSETEETALLELLCEMMRTMVDLSMGLDSVQMIVPAFMAKVVEQVEIELKQIQSDFNDTANTCSQKGGRG